MKDLGKKIKYFIFGILVFLLYFKILPFGLSYILGAFFKDSSKFVKNLALSGAEITILLVLFLIFKKKIVEDFKNFIKNFRNHLNTGFKYYFIGFLVMIASNLILSIIFGGIATNEEVNRQYLKSYPIYSVITMVFVGPLIEEIVFRLGFRKSFDKWLPYALFSGLFFGSLHVYTAFQGMAFAEMLKNWSQVLYIIPYSALGFAFAKAFYETDNIWTTMVIHVLHNAFTVFLIFSAV